MDLSPEKRKETLKLLEEAQGRLCRGAITVADYVERLNHIREVIGLVPYTEEQKLQLKQAYEWLEEG